MNTIRKRPGRRVFAGCLVFAAWTCSLGRSATAAYDIIDSVGWRAGQTSVTGVTETYSYDAASDKITVTLKFNASGAKPLPPMLALSRQYGFPVSFDKAPVATNRNSIFGPLEIVNDASDTYSYTVAGLNKYVVKDAPPGAKTVPAHLTAALEAQIGKATAAGHLRPWFYISNNPDNTDSEAGGRAILYWVNPGEQLYYLSAAADVLSGPVGASLKTYMKTEREAYPPERSTGISFTEGACRDYYTVPDDDIRHYWDFGARWVHEGPRGNTAVPKIWGLYGLARYYETMGEIPTAAVFDACKAIVTAGNDKRDWASFYWQKGFSPHFNAVHGVNQTFAGLAGYIRLARMVNDRDAEAMGFGLLAHMAALRFAMAKYAQYEWSRGILPYGATASSNPSTDPRWWAEYMAGDTKQVGWLGDLLCFRWSSALDNARQVITLDETRLDTWEWCGMGMGRWAVDWQTNPLSGNGINGQKLNNQVPWGEALAEDLNNVPYLVAFADMAPELGRFLSDYCKPETELYVKRYTEENLPYWYAAFAEEIVMMEKGCASPMNSWSMFMAKAWIVKEPAQQLALYSDVPWLAKGDLFYIHKLAETVRAYRNGQVAAVFPHEQGGGMNCPAPPRLCCVIRPGAVTVIRYSIPNSGPVQLAIFNQQGKLLHTLVNGIKNAGTHHAIWNANVPAAGPVPSGMYLCRLSAGGRTGQKQIVVVK